MKVIGSTGSQEKVDFVVNELGCKSTIPEICHVHGNAWLLHMLAETQDWPLVLLRHMLI